MIKRMQDVVASSTVVALTVYRRLMAGATLAWITCESALAQTLPEPPGNVSAEDGDFLGMIGKYIYRAAPLLLILLMVAAVSYAVWLIVGKINDWRSGRTDTGDVVGKTIGVIVLLAVVAAMCVYGLTIITDNQGFLEGGGGD